MTATRILALGVALLGSPVFAEGDVPPGTVFVCDEGSATSPAIQVVIPPRPDGTATLMLDSEALEMAPVPVGSGFGYDIVLPLGHFLVRGKGSEVMLFVDDQDPKLCVLPAGFEAPDTATYPKAASLGGNVRSGPGIDFARSGSLGYGAPLSILTATGVIFDGYEWFEIEDTGGQRGFHWGGIMCSLNADLPGVFSTCPADIQ
ncbi:MAG: hypothetical protein MRY75_12325 [Marivita sp.]|uniref:hypothetical protein n=1 Tax=Marivita sp. TaxID=2003365 RepID=UPI0025BF208D|nr:hypothetical protein [Marivita sp.]MCI5111329.1 hypothetical protein [Marivita sp.]